MTKAGRPQLLPLPNAAVEILKALPRGSVTNRQELETTKRAILRIPPTIRN
jgi:hypothetical protein